MILEPKSQKGSQNDQKSIRFIDKTHMAFRHVEKPYEPCRKWRLLRGQKLKYKPCEARIIMIDWIIIIIIIPLYKASNGFTSLVGPEW